MNQVQTVQKPVPVASAQPKEEQVIQDEMVEKKSGWFKWLLIILVILIVGFGIAWLFGVF